MILHQKILISIITLFALNNVICLNEINKEKTSTGFNYKQVWNYANIRKNVNIFWWLYYAENFNEKPLILWLQGGPGASSTGYGNFMEIGPMDMNSNFRNTTWLKLANLLFIDNPVGTGFSYATSDDAFCTTVNEIANDLVETMKMILKQLPQFQITPFYIFSESYGGKMTAVFSQELYSAIEKKNINCNFKGFAMGDSWISPLDSVLSWSTFLHSTSLVDIQGYDKINKKANECRQAFEDGNYTKSTSLWSDTESTVEKWAANVNFYNILKFDPTTTTKYAFGLEKLYKRYVLEFQDQSLDEYMNTVVRKKLEIIPKNVIWGGQSNKVFEKQSDEFMKPVYSIVDQLLKSTNLEIIVYSGQLDLICNTVGTETWINRLKWTGLEKFNIANRYVIRNPQNNSPIAFYKVPSDAGNAAFEMLRNIL